MHRKRENIVLAPRCRQGLQGRLELESEQSLPILVIVEPIQILIERIFPARALTRIEPSAQCEYYLSASGRKDNILALRMHYSNHVLTVELNCEGGRAVA